MLQGAGYYGDDPYAPDAGWGAPAAGAAGAGGMVTQVGKANTYTPPTAAPTPENSTTSYSGPGWSPRAFDLSAPEFNFGNVPNFTYTPFKAPTMEEAKAEPGYALRLNAGSDALERSAAAKGTLRTGGTLKGIEEYGQNFAAQEYDNLYKRALQAYGAQYQGERDAYAPHLEEWRMLSNAEVQAKMAAYQAMVAQHAQNQNAYNSMFQSAIQSAMN